MKLTRKEILELTALMWRGLLFGAIMIEMCFGVLLWLSRDIGITIPN